MRIQNEIISNFRNFIQSVETIENGEKKLKEFRNIIIGDLNLKNSRCVWMSLILYKFKQEMSVSEELWILSRQLIISLLKSDINLRSIIAKYLEIFDKWQKQDLNELLNAISINYYNLIQIKKSIENTNNEQTLKEWMPHYSNLILKIRN